MPEELERRQTILRIDPALHFIMKAAQEVLHLPSVDDVYELAANEYLTRHPDISAAVVRNIETGQVLAVSAIEKLRAK